MKRVFLLLALTGLLAASCSNAVHQGQTTPSAAAQNDPGALAAPVQGVFTASADNSIATVTNTPAQANTETRNPAPGSDVESKEKPPVSLEIISVSSPVRPGESATLKAHTTPGATCVISVYYTSARSAAEGLVTKTSEASGNVFWTWKIGSDRAPGSYRIEVSASLGEKHASQTTYIVIS